MQILIYAHVDLHYNREHFFEANEAIHELKVFKFLWTFMHERVHKILRVERLPKLGQWNVCHYSMQNKEVLKSKITNGKNVYIDDPEDWIICEK